MWVTLTNMPHTLTSKQIAHRLWVELHNRITSQSLHNRSGDEETAAESVASLFKTTRDLLKQADAEETKELTILLDVMLNEVTRPYSARWRGWIQRGVLSDPIVSRHFRIELECLREKLEDFVEALRYYSLEGKWQPEFTPVENKDTTSIKEKKNKFLKHYHSKGIEEKDGFESLKAKIIEDVPLHPNYLSGREVENPDTPWETVFDDELTEISARRGKDHSSNGKITNLTGISLSGGGLRSAAFCLGALAPLARKKLIADVDYLSTVSGGGYAGAFLTENLNREELYPKGTDKKEDPAKVLYEKDGGQEHKFIRYLRNHSDYLFSGGFMTKFKIFSLLIAGVFTNIFSIIPLIILSTLVYFFLDQYLSELTSELKNLPSFGDHWGQYLCITFLLISFSFWFLYAIALKYFHGRSKGGGIKSFLRIVSLASFLGFLLFIGITLLTQIQNGVLHYFNMAENQPSRWHGWKTTFTYLISTGIIPLISGLLIRYLSPTRKILFALVKTTFTLSGPLFYLVTHLILWVALHSEGIEAAVFRNNIIILTSLSLLVIFWSLIVDLNSTSPHHFYKDRLSLGFLLKQQDQGEGGAHTPLHELNKEHKSPYLLINCALNLHHSDNLSLRDRNSDFFIFSKKYCGSPTTGYVCSEKLHNTDPHIDLASCMAISGAAVSSQMGRKTVHAFRLALTILNIRLGYWIPNIFPSCTKERAKITGPNQYRIFQEMFGINMKEKNKFLNISDGGHIENFGTYELLRRRCKYIVAIEGSSDPKAHFQEFNNLQRLVNLDFGIKIEIDLSDLTLDEHKNSRFHSALGKVSYPRGNDEYETGWILYLKLTTTGEEPDHISDYQRRFPAFPHQTTADQYYTEEQFHAYYALGEFASEKLVAHSLVGDLELDGGGSPTQPTIENWFKGLAQKILNEDLTK